jgi:hypothetical protein
MKAAIFFFFLSEVEQTWHKHSYRSQEHKNDEKVTVHMYIKSTKRSMCFIYGMNRYFPVNGIYSAVQTL